MKNYFLLFLLVGGFFLSINVNNVSALALPPLPPLLKRQAPATPPAPTEPPSGPTTGDAKGGTWQTLTTTSGVNSMHLFVASYNQVVMVDKVEANPLVQSNGAPAISSLFNTDANTIAPLDLSADTFCSAGSWLGNGTLLHTGGDNGNTQFVAGQQTLRFYNPATSTWTEKVGLMQSKRWYPTMLPLVDGRVLILGGSIGGTGLNTAALNNPTYNIYPPKNGGEAPDPDITFQFLVDTLPYNLYVFCHIIPNNLNKNILFVLANQQSVQFDLDTGNVLGTYPKIDIQRTYPQTGTSVMLPLYPDTNYKPVVMVCGGQAAFESTSTAAASCGRLDLSITNPAWQMDDFGGIPRVMPDSVILPNGQILFLNGAQTGIAGFRKGSKAAALWVNSNPAFSPVLFDPTSGTYTQMNPSTIARMYHSVATLLPEGYVLVSGSNPQASVQRDVQFPTEYRMELFKPPYLLNNVPRPTILSINGTIINQSRIPIGYGQPLILTVKFDQVPTTPPSFTAAIIHLGFVTHSQNMGQRYVGLTISAANYDSADSSAFILTMTTPPNPTILAPGPHFIYVSNNGAPCIRAAEVLLN